jgi:hypothetical protein
MANFFVMLLFGLIGAFFGPVGFWIGIVIGIFGWIGSKKDKSKSKPVPSRSGTPAFTGNEHVTPSPQQTGPSLDQVREYTSIVIDLFAVILSFYPNSDGTKVSAITELLKHDDWMPDKVGALEELAKRLPLVQVERRDSAMLFQLHCNAIIEKVVRLPSPMKNRLLMQLDSFAMAYSDADPKDCLDFVGKIISAIQQNSPASTERFEAEELIARSGDAKAIGTLQEMRRNPSRYRELLRNGAGSNTVLKTAFGVFAGLLAADAVRAAVTSYQMQNLHTQLDRDIAQAGGLDSIPLKDQGLDSMVNSGAGGDFSPNFVGGVEENSWGDEMNEASSVIDGSDLTAVDDDPVINVYTGADTLPDVEIADSGSDFSFSFDD